MRVISVHFSVIAEAVDGSYNIKPHHYHCTSNSGAKEVKELFNNNAKQSPAK